MGFWPWMHLLSVLVQVAGLCLEVPGTGMFEVDHKTVFRYRSPHIKLAAPVSGAAHAKPRSTDVELLRPPCYPLNCARG